MLNFEIITLDVISKGLFLLVLLVWLYYIIRPKALKKSSPLWIGHLVGILILVTSAVIDLAAALMLIKWSGITWQIKFLTVIGLILVIITARNLLANQYGVVAELKKEVTVDHLTGIGNLRYLEELWPEISKFAELNNENIAVIFLDIDEFKQINDQYGHSYGDEVLKTITSVVRSTLRKADYLIRYAGDEFIVILPGNGYFKTIEVIKRIKEAVRQVPLPDNAEAGVSCGLAIYPLDGTDIKTLIDTADQRMYQYKNNTKKIY